MANENVVVNISATSDFSNLIADVNRVSATLSKLQRDLVISDKAIAKNVQKLNADFANALTSSGQFSKYFVSLTSGAENFGKSLDSGRLKLRDYFSTLRTHFTEQRSLISDLAKQQTMLQNALIQPLGKNAQGLMQYNIMVARGLDEVANKTKIAQTQAAIMNRVIQQGANQLINWGKNTQWAGRQLTVGLTVPLAAFGKAAADAFRLADKELVRLTKVYGDLSGATAGELGKIRDEVTATARELSANLGASFRETLGLAADVAATGKTGAELIGSVRETTRLAVLGEVDRQEAMKATLAIQSAFKQNTDELSDSINFLNAVENQTSTSLNDLVEAIPKAGPVIKGLGGSIQDLALYITAMREGGITASEGANALKSALASLINPTDVAVKKFESFGIDLLGIVTKNAGDVTQTLFALQAALDRLDPLQKQQAIEQLFGKFQFSRLNALFENLGKQGSQTLQVLDLMKASTAELGAVADRELAIVTESASGRYARAVEKLKADLAGIGEEFLGIATKIINVIDKFVNFVAGLPDPIKKVMGLAAGITAIAGPIIMLTGVLGNFFGYIIKGVSHFRAFFKGAEGWKLLTPEILAANAAAQQIDDTFYSDAKAADVLRNALQNLINEYSLLESKVESASISLASSATTVQNNPLYIGPREVDPNNPLIGPYQTRASAHMNPVAEMTAEQKASQTFLGMVPSSIQVNRLIGQNPMILAQGDLPRIEGLTSVTRKVGRGQSAQTIPISTGVLADEVAKWHAMTSALAMSSKAEIKDLKKSIAMTGVVTTEFMDKFDDILPAVTQITDNGARMSAAIVAELQAGKLTVQQARERIIALNFEIERMLAEEVTRIAAARGVSINLANVPMITQPAANPVSGESNMRQMFRRDNEQFLRDLGTVIGVRTSGAGFNVQTTRPKRLNKGGEVYTMAQGNIVPGPNINADVVPAMLTPGEFVVNREATSRNLPLLQAINGSTREAGPSSMLGGFMSSRAANAILGVFGVTSRSQKSARLVGNWGMLMPKRINDQLAMKRGAKGASGLELKMLLNDPNRLIDLERFLAFRGVKPTDIAAAKKRVAARLSQKLNSNALYDDKTFGRLSFSAIDDEIRALELSYPGLSLAYQKDRMMPGRRDTASSNPTKHGPSPTAINIPGMRGSSYGSGKGGDVWGHFSDEAFDANIAQLGKTLGFNKGGRVPGYAGGGQVRKYNLGGFILPAIASQLAFSAGSSLGARAGGDMGAMVGGSIASMLPFMLMGSKGRGADLESRAGKSVFAGSKLGDDLTRAAGGANRFTATLSRMALGLTRTNLAIGGTVAAVGIAVKMYRDWQKEQELIAQSFGLTEDSAKKLGLRFTDYNKVIKNTITNTQAVIERNKLLYESMTLSSSPFSLTISQYKELRKEVEKTMQAQIEMVNAADYDDLNGLAKRLKEQFIIAGMSADEATKKIFALFELSNKSSFAARVTVGNREFTKIKDTITAATASYQSFATATRSEGPKAQVNALNTALSGTQAAIDKIVEKNKKNQDQSKTLYQSEAEFINKIKNTKAAEVQISEEALDLLRKQNPEIAQFLTTQDTVLTTWQKISIATKGYTGDLSRLNTQQTDALFNIVSSNYDQIVATTRKGLLKEEYDQLDNLENQRKRLIGLSRQQSVREQIDTRKRLELLQKEIDKINEKADARIKALNQEQDDENIVLQIQKARLEYQDALAAGDMSRAAQAQLDIQGLVGEQQRTLATRAIEERRDRDIAPLRREIDRIRDKEQKLADAAALAAGKLDKLNAEISTLQGKINDVVGAFTNYKTAVDTNAEDMKGVSAAFVKAAESIGIAAPQPKLPETARQADLAQSYGIETRASNLFDSILGKISKPNEVYLEAKEVFIGTELNPVQVDASKYKGKIVGKIDQPLEKLAFRRGEDITSADVGKIFKYNGQLYEVDKFGDIFERKAGGGAIIGPGTTTSDSIPILASNGEYMLSAQAVKNAGGIQAVDTMHQYFKNANKMKDGGPISSYFKNIAEQNKGYSGFGSGLLNAGPSASLSRILGGMRESGDILNVLGTLIGLPLGRATQTGALAKSLYAIPNKLYQLRNSLKVKSMIKSDLWHGSQPMGSMGEEFLQGENILDGAMGNDPFYGMGFFGTTSKAEADLYAGGYNSFNNWGSAFGSLNLITKAPRGKYIDFTKGPKSIKWQDYALAQALGKDFMPTNLGSIMNSQGIIGGIMNRVNSGFVPKDIANAKWLAWSNPRGVNTKEYLGKFEVPRFHNWNGVVPGPYNKEISATLKAGTEGVYQNSYIASLKDRSTGNTYYNQPKIEVYPAPGMDESMLADLVLKKFNQQNAKMAAAQGRSVYIKS